VFEHHHDVFLQHTKIATPLAFVDLLKTATNNPEPAHAFPLMDTNQSNVVEPAASTLANLLDSFFVCSWDIYLTSRLLDMIKLGN
jgi:hypothetical protein